MFSCLVIVWSSATEPMAPRLGGQPGPGAGSGPVAIVPWDSGRTPPQRARCTLPRDKAKSGAAAAGTLASLMRGGMTCFSHPAAQPAARLARDSRPSHGRVTSESRPSHVRVTGGQGWGRERHRTAAQAEAPPPPLPLSPCPSCVLPQAWDLTSRRFSTACG
jgi:hypothetical protein